MSNLVNLKRERQAVILEGTTLLNKIETEKRSPSEEEQTKLTGLKAQADELRQRIERLEEWEGLADEVRGGAEPTTPDPQDVTWQSAPKPAEQRQAELEFKFGQYLQAVVRSSRPGGRIDPMLVEQRAPTGMGELVPSDGGFLVQQDFSTELYRRAYTMGEITQRCRRVPISANANSMKLLGIDETSRATGSRWGGIRGYWLAEAGTLTASKPKFLKIELNLHKLGVLAYATDELLQDAATLGNILMEAASEEIMWLTENAIINGTGAGQPLGVLNAAATVSQAKETGQAAATVVAKNVMKMRSRMWGRSRANSVWLVEQDVEPQLHEMTIAVGTGGIPVYMPAGGLSDSPYDRLYTRPVLPVEYCAALGTVGDILYADFSQYLLADKGGIQAASSIHVQFLNDETVFRFIYRVDGQPLWHAPLTPASGGSTRSPFVSLATRA